MNPTHSGRIVIAGGSGFLGLNLAEHLASAGSKVVILSRSAPRESGPWKHRSWDGRTLGDWVKNLDGCRALVNLAGRSVDCIKTPDHYPALPTHPAKIASSTPTEHRVRHLGIIDQPPFKG